MLLRNHYHCEKLSDCPRVRVDGERYQLDLLSRSTTSSAVVVWIQSSCQTTLLNELIQTYFFDRTTYQALSFHYVGADIRLVDG
jgi:hypothetical protein